MILAICNNDPGIVNINILADSKIFNLNWSELPLVQDLFTLNILLVSTLCLGWGALVLDVITAAIKNFNRSRDKDTEDLEEASFWDNAILLEGLKYAVGPSLQELPYRKLNFAVLVVGLFQFSILVFVVFLTWVFDTPESEVPNPESVV